MSCKVGAGTAEESAALWELQPELLWTVIKIPQEGKRERKTYLGFLPPAPAIGEAPKEPIWQGSGESSLFGL